MERNRTRSRVFKESKKAEKRQEMENEVSCEEERRRRRSIDIHGWDEAEQELMQA